eukprot:TRINITY_DN650_c0_g1_i1.p1 TRINITY_DN650_c0_g1~~TRINITY_DN650_c0_g1_i1.p1  ORF type:complete len:294 (-),score=84.49 TRINITY_DN650_c0_g1_i1:1678-2559(-)
MINFLILLLVLLAALTTAFITHPLLPMAVRGDRSTRNPLRMVTGAPQPPPPPQQQQLSVLELLSEEPYKYILKYFKGWSVDDFLAVTETQIEKLVPQEHLSTGYRLYHRMQEQKLKPEAKTIYIVASAGGKPMKYGFTTQAELDAYLTRMGAGGLMASGTEFDAVLLKLEKLEEGATYSLEFGDGAPLYKLQENVKAVGAQATAWEKQCARAVLHVFEREGKLQQLNGIKVPVFGATREMNGAFFSREANLLFLCEVKTGPMELSGFVSANVHRTLLSLSSTNSILQHVILTS